jgi:integrase
VHSHLVDYFRSLRNGYDEMLGRSPRDRTVWDLVDVGLSPEPVYRGARKRKGIDFGEIEQIWLRKVLMGWAAEQTDAPTVRECFRATRLASIALSQCADRGDRPSSLTYVDATTVAEIVAQASTPRGKPGSPKYRRDLYNIFFGLITYARRRRIEDISAEFVSDREHLSLFSEPPEEENSGRAIPTYIQRQLDANLDTIGQGFQHGMLSNELVHLLFRTAYVVLRDTGRRPLEVVSLKRNCLRHDASGAPILIYDNHKAGRMNRQLPILRSTAEAIEEWREAYRPNQAAEDSYMFPGALARHKHLLTYHLSATLRAWVDSLDRLDTNECDGNGSPLPFDRKLIYPYAFRHSYAQRHADNGVAIDVLRELLDHRSMRTTIGYYTITADRKREAIEIVGKYTTDRTGSPAPIAVSAQYQMSSVAVPFGNCIEPSNVKAGGHACPIRFQCAGCGFYRPDPSYIPAIEEHIVTLKADRETAEALGSASFVVDNLSAQIAAFEKVLSTMHANIDQLDADEKVRVETASAALRKVRAGVPLPLTVANLNTSH